MKQVWPQINPIRWGVAIWECVTFISFFIFCLSSSPCFKFLIYYKIINKVKFYNTCLKGLVSNALRGLILSQYMHKDFVTYFFITQSPLDIKLSKFGHQIILNLISNYLEAVFYISKIWERAIASLLVLPNFEEVYNKPLKSAPWLFKNTDDYSKR